MKPTVDETMSAAAPRLSGLDASSQPETPAATPSQGRVLSGDRPAGPAADRLVQIAARVLDAAMVRFSTDQGPPGGGAGPRRWRVDASVGIDAPMGRRLQTDVYHRLARCETGGTIVPTLSDYRDLARHTPSGADVDGFAAASAHTADGDRCLLEVWTASPTSVGIETVRTLRDLLTLASESSAPRPMRTTPVGRHAAAPRRPLTAGLSSTDRRHPASAAADVGDREAALVEGILAASAAAVTVLDAGGRIVRANERAEEVLGLQASRVEGRAYDDPEWKITTVAGDPFPADQLPFARVQRTGRPVFDVRHAIEGPGGRRRILSISGAPLGRTGSPSRPSEPSGAVFVIQDETRLHQRQTELQAEKERLHLARTSANIGFWEFDRSEFGLRVDALGARMLGYEQAEIGDAEAFLQRHIHPDDRHRVDRQLRQHRAGRRSLVDLEIRFRAKNGSWRWILHRGKVLTWTADGRPQRAMGTHMDVTERKEAVRAMIDHERRYRVALRHSPIVFARVDPELRYEWILNPHDDFHAVDITGRRDDDLSTGPGIDDLVALKESVFDSGDQQRREITFVTSDGPVTYDVTATPLREHKRGPVVGLVTASLDVTARKQIERDLRHTKASLEEAQSMTRTGSGRWDIDRGTVVLSAEAGRLLDVEPGVEHPLTIFFERIHPDDRSLLRRELNRLKRGLRHDAEYRVRPPGTGRTAWVRGRARPERAADGRVAWAVGTITDITEEKDLRAELIAAREKAEQATRLQSAFLANIGHEIRTPLTALLGFAEVLDDLDLDAPADHFVELLDRSSRRLYEMLTSILDLSQLQADEVTLHPTDVGLGSSLAEAVAPFADAAKEAGITLSVATGDAPPSIYADADAFQNVISKLIHNSIKFTEPGGRVVVAARLDGGEVVVTVEDTGIGIPEAFLPDAFRPFTQASTGDDREYEGSGLGLAVAQRLVDRMQGSISIDSTVGTGTCVTVRLPAEPPQEEPPQEEPPHERSDGAEPGDPAP